MLDAIGVVSRDIQKSVDFYKIFGIELRQEGGPDHWEGKTSSGLRLMIDSVTLIQKLNPAWTAPTGSGLILCFKQNSAADVDQLFHQVVNAGFRPVKEPWDAFWGQRYASVEDPDGNQVDIFADL